ncbi:MAG: amino acid adenylation domain-containing protein [Leptolyngbyaceae cyanobacterium]
MTGLSAKTLRQNDGASTSTSFESLHQGFPDHSIFPIPSEWCGKVNLYPRESCVHEIFQEQARQTPEAIALVFKDQTLSYRALDEQSNQLAHYLKSLGVGLESIVGVYLDRSIELIVTLLGILKVGAAYLPLDPSAPGDRIATILDDAQCEVLVTQDKWQHQLPEATLRLQLQILNLEKDWQTVRSCPVIPIIHRAAADSLAYVMYTSGSTGKPKGVCVVHRGVTRLVQGTDYVQFDSTQVFLQMASIAFDAATLEIWGPLLNGGKLVLLPGNLPNLETLGTLIQQHQVTTLWLTAGLFHLMVDERLQDLKPLRQLLSGGDVLSMPHVQRVLEELPHCQLINGYGPTENTTFTCCYPIPRDQSTTGTVSIGRPIANTQVYILDEFLQPVGVETPGELYVGGDGLARGYLNQPELTAERFIPNPFDQDGTSPYLYKTGDRVQWRPDGTIEFLGRIDFQVKIRGFRIELGEIELALVKHPAVRNTVVLAREDHPGTKQLVAYVVPEVTSAPGTDQPDQDQVLVAELRQFLGQTLPDYMVPATFVILEEFPLNINGKVDRKALPAPATIQFSLREFIAPSTPVETTLVRIWQEVLNTTTALGIHDVFAELGGDSLQATRIVARIQDAFAIGLSVETVLEAGTVAALAQRIEQAQAQVSASQLLPLKPIARSNDFALSLYQERMWLMQQQAGDRPIYNLPMAFRLRGTLNIPALEAAVNVLIQRHEALRTIFPVIQGLPVQHLLPQALLSLPAEKMASGEAEDTEAAIQTWIEAEARAPFDLSQDLPIRVRLLQIEPTEHILTITPHHLVTDGWSLGILRRDLGSIYTALVDHQPLPNSNLSLQYGDFALWHRSLVEQPDRQATLVQYWTEHLAGASPLLELPSDRPRPGSQSFKGKTKRFSIDAALLQDLKALSQHHGTTLFMTLLTTFSILLHRYTAQEKVVVSSPIGSRNAASALEDTVGCFANLVPFCSDFSHGHSFTDLLAQLKQVALNHYAQVDFSVKEVLNQLQIQRDLSYSPWFQVAFILLNTPADELQMPGLEIESLPVEKGTALFDLTLLLEQSDSGLQGSLEYSTDLFDDSTIDHLIQHFQVLCQSIVATPTQSIATLPMLTEAERHQLLVEWNQTQTDYPRDKCIHQLFEEQAERTPDAVAVVLANQQMTYKELNERANQLAHRLRSLHVEPNTLVGLCLDRSFAMVIGLLAILKVGAAYVPLDPNYPEERLGFMLEDTQVSVLLTTSVLAKQFNAIGLLPASIQPISMDVADLGLETEPNTNLPVGTTATDLAYVMYTSGSTGKPKGVCVPHRGVVRLVKQTNYLDITAKDTFLQLAPIAFDAATLEIWGALLNGARLVLFPESTPTPRTIGQAVSDHQVTILWLTSGLFHLVVDHSLDWFQSLRYLLAGGDVLSVPHVQRTVEQLPHCTVINGYGPTENTTFTCCHPIPSPLPTDQSVPIGRPIANTTTYILDSQLQPVPMGIPGELYIGGDGLAQGYFNRPELTAERFVANPFARELGERLYKTGDLVRYLPDGAVEFLGRLDNQVKLRGFRIELGEIETAIAQFNTVKTAVVIVREDQPGDKRLVAYVVPNTTQSLNPDTLRQQLKQQLPEYMVPSTVVEMETLPLNANGKVDRRALPKPQAISASVSFPDKPEPESVLELQLVNLCQRLLNCPRMTGHDNFFDQGGNSLLAAQLCAEAEAILQSPVPITALFQTQTMRELAAVLSSQQAIAPSSLVGLRSNGTKRPLFFINSISEARALLPWVSQAQPIYGLNIFSIRSLFEHRSEPLTLEDIARQFLTDLRTIQPHGPYQLAGFCQDGALTLELARQLHEQGEAIAFVGLIDSLFQTYTKKWWHRFPLIREFGWAYFRERGQRQLVKRLKAQTPTVKEDELDINSRLQLLEASKKDQAFYRRYVDMVLPCRPQYHGSKITMLLSSELRFADFHKLQQAIGSPEVEIEIVKGLHSALFEKPYVEELAAKLEKHLHHSL